MPRARCSFSRKDGRALSHSDNGREHNLAFYRDGDFFGELSILNGSPRAASVEAFSDCSLLALEPHEVRELKRHFPEFGKLMEERLAQYQAKTEARVPLDFTTEMLPAEVRAHDKIAVDADQTAANRTGTRGPVRRRKRIVPEAQGAHSKNRVHSANRRNGLRRRQSGNDLPSLRTQGQPLADSPALSHLDRRDEPEGDLSRGHGIGLGSACSQGVAAQSAGDAAAGDHPLGRQSLDGALRSEREVCPSGRSGDRSPPDSAERIRDELVGLRRASSITPSPSKRRRKARRRSPGCSRSSRSSRQPSSR